MYLLVAACVAAIVCAASGALFVAVLTLVPTSMYPAAASIVTSASIATLVSKLFTDLRRCCNYQEAGAFGTVEAHPSD